MFPHFIVVSSSIPYVNHRSIYGNTNLAVECARYFEKGFPFLTWGYCVSLYLWITIYYIGTTLVFGMFYGLCRIYVYMWLWILYISHGICSCLKISILISWWLNFWLDLSTDASLLEVLWVSFILVQLLRIVIRWVLHYFFSFIFILYSSMLLDGTSVADICQEALWFFVWYMCCVCFFNFWSMSHSI